MFLLATLTAVAIAAAEGVLLSVDAPWLTLISGLVIPLIVGLVTKKEATTGVKSLATVILAAVASLLQVLVAGGGILTQSIVLQFVITLGLALGAFYGIYSPADTDGKLAPDRGFGKVIDTTATDGHFAPR